MCFNAVTSFFEAFFLRHRVQHNAYSQSIGVSILPCARSEWFQALNSNVTNKTQNRQPLIDTHRE